MTQTPPEEPRIQVTKTIEQATAEAQSLANMYSRPFYVFRDGFGNLSTTSHASYPNHVLRTCYPEKPKGSE
jgi:hypothetical protein